MRDHFEKETHEKETQLTKVATNDDDFRQVVDPFEIDFAVDVDRWLGSRST